MRGHNVIAPPRDEMNESFRRALFSRPLPAILEHGASFASNESGGGSHSSSSDTDQYSTDKKEEGWDLDFVFHTCALCVHGLLLIAAFVLTSTYFASSGQARNGQSTFSLAKRAESGFSRSYVLAPVNAGCVAWKNGACVAVGDADAAVAMNERADRERIDWRGLSGTLVLEEHVASGLFSEMNPMVICLIVQAIIASLLLVLFAGKCRDAQSRWLLKKTALALILFFAGLLLFMQSRWYIPQNNLLWLEMVLVGALYVLSGIESREPSLDLASSSYARCDIEDNNHNPTDNNGDDQARGGDSQRLYLACVFFSIPMLGVAALAMAGDDDAPGLVISYCGMSAAMVIWLLEGIPNNTAPWLLRLNAWLCVAPFIIRASLRLSEIAGLPSLVQIQTPAGWIITTLRLVLGWTLGMMCVFTISCVRDGGARIAAWRRHKEGEAALLSGAFTKWVALLAYNAAHVSILLSIMIGMTVAAIA